MSTLTRQGYQQLIDGDLDWLLAQPRTLERDHIALVMRHSVEMLYGPQRQVVAGICPSCCADEIAAGKAHAGELCPACAATDVDGDKACADHGVESPEDLWSDGNPEEGGS